MQILCILLTSSSLRCLTVFLALGRLSCPWGICHLKHSLPGAWAPAGHGGRWARGVQNDQNMGLWCRNNKLSLLEYEALKGCKSILLFRSFSNPVCRYTLVINTVEKTSWAAKSLGHSHTVSQAEVNNKASKHSITCVAFHMGPSDTRTVLSSGQSSSIKNTREPSPQHPKGQIADCLYVNIVETRFKKVVGLFRSKRNKLHGKCNLVLCFRNVKLTSWCLAPHHLILEQVSSSVMGVWLFFCGLLVGVFLFIKLSK